MPIRIIGHGKGYDTQILDDETGQDLTSLLQVSAVTLACDKVPTAQLTALLPRVDVVVQEATVLQRCPYCGHERISKVHNASEALKLVGTQHVISASDLEHSQLAFEDHVLQNLEQLPRLSEEGA